MHKLTVIDLKDGVMLEQITERLRKARTNGAAGVSLSGWAAVENGLTPDLLLVSPKAGIRLETLPSCRCGMLLLPGKLRGFRDLHAECVVSYGMSTKDSVTLSSIDNDSIMLTIQREIPTVSGDILERQEIPALRLHGESPDDALAGTAALLLLGLPVS